MRSEIRLAQSGDLGEIIALYQQLNSDDPLLANGQDLQAYKQILQREGLEIFVLESDGRIVSTCYLNVIPNLTRAARPYAIIENVVTDEACRGSGYGKRVIQHAIEYAWSQNCYKVMLMTGSKEESTHAFYRACGFDGDEKQAYIVRSPN